MFKKKFVINLNGDNNASLFAAENYAISKKLRHLRVSYHYFKENIERSNFTLH